MSSNDSQQPNRPESRPSSYTAVLLTAVVALLLGMLIAQSITAAKVADTPKAVAAAVQTLDADLRILTSISDELSALSRQIETVVVEPAVLATFTATAAR